MIGKYYSLSTQGGKKMRTAEYPKSLTVAFRPDVFHQMKEITDERKISLGEFVRQAVDDALKKEASEELRF
jgi:hypothetical protein